MSARILVGTSGYNYPEWRGSFYPEKFATTKMLAFYAEHFQTVEINYTFYRMPTEKLLRGWADGTPEHFTFTLKAPRRITHDAKLQRLRRPAPGRSAGRRGRSGRKLGVLLFQLPPTFKKDADVLRSFPRTCSPRARARPSSSGTRRGSMPTIFDALRDRNVALCMADSEKLKHAGGDDGRLRATSGCATRAISRPTSKPGPRPSADCRSPTRSSTSSTKSRGSAPSSRSA